MLKTGVLSLWRITLGRSLAFDCKVFSAFAGKLGAKLFTRAQQLVCSLTHVIPAVYSIVETID